MGVGVGDGLGAGCSPELDDELSEEFPGAELDELLDPELFIGTNDPFCEQPVDRTSTTKEQIAVANEAY